MIHATSKLRERGREREHQVNVTQVATYDITIFLSFIFNPKNLVYGPHITMRELHPRDSKMQIK